MRAPACGPSACIALSSTNAPKLSFEHLAAAAEKQSATACMSRLDMDSTTTMFAPVAAIPGIEGSTSATPQSRAVLVGLDRLRATCWTSCNRCHEKLLHRLRADHVAGRACPGCPPTKNSAASPAKSDEADGADRHAVFDLIANRTLAHLEQRGLGAGRRIAWLCAPPTSVADSNLASPRRSRRCPDCPRAGQCSAAVPLTSAPGRPWAEHLVRVKVQAPSSPRSRGGGEGQRGAPSNRAGRRSRSRCPLPRCMPGENAPALTFAHVRLAGARQSGPSASRRGGALATGWWERAARRTMCRRAWPMGTSCSSLATQLHYYVYIPRGGALASAGAGAVRSRAAAGRQQGGRGSRSTRRAAGWQRPVAQPLMPMKCGG